MTPLAKTTSLLVAARKERSKVQVKGLAEELVRKIILARAWGCPAQSCCMEVEGGMDTLTPSCRRTGDRSDRGLRLNLCKLGRVWAFRPLLGPSPGDNPDGLTITPPDATDPQLTNDAKALRVASPRVGGHRCSSNGNVLGPGELRDTSEALRLPHGLPRPPPSPFHVLHCGRRGLPGPRDLRPELERTTGWRTSFALASTAVLPIACEEITSSPVRRHTNHPTSGRGDEGSLPATEVL